MPWYVYILCSKDRRFLYIGQSSDLRKRVEQHRANAVDAYTARHRVHRLVYFETHDTLRAALLRERKLKRWRRAWKDNLVESVNPEWRDLTDGIPF